uniref:LAGLIDADG-2 homing endonuclease n=1 Tax=Ankistrodesmus falcatus TaxID=52960 RepID=A0A7L7K570_9CHLO|nr:LAGLIDADG-2 homing endonuclease [Ankistrodesmus falcatus]QMS48905.1 LAGLIDADG-2 homing endonuclease [Ankistrodesmus falcatus]
MHFFVCILSQTFPLVLKKPAVDEYWLVGFFEADGCLSVFNNKQKQVSLSFILRQADPKVLYQVKSFLGCGSVYMDKQGYWTYCVRNKEGLLKIVEILNGKLVFTKGLKQYKTWVEAFNQKYKTSLVPVTTPATLSWNNAWLTGFADAEGSFNIMLGVRKDTCQPRLRLRFYLDQSYSLESMQVVQDWLGGSLHCKQTKNKNHHRLMVDTFNKSTLLVDYFSKFPPLTTCLFVRFIRYARVYQWYVTNQWKKRLENIQHLILLNKRLQKKPKN